MAKTTSTRGGLLAQQQVNNVQVAQQGSPLQLMLNKSEIQAKFNKMLGDEAAGFMSTILSVCANNKLLKNADPRTILSAAATAASLKMSIAPSLGKAYIVPYKGAAAFQLGYKGAIELAQRSGKMKFITACPVYEGEITKWDKFTETIERGDKISDKIIGYYASFQLLNGFTKSTYWTVEEVKKHALKYSQQCKFAGKLAGVWAEQFDAMACKTVLMSILKAYAPMSIKMQEAVVADGSVSAMDENGNVETFDFIEAETIEPTANTEPVEPLEPQGDSEVPPADYEVPMD